MTRPTIRQICTPWQILREVIAPPMANACLSSVIALIACGCCGITTAQTEPMAPARSAYLGVRSCSAVACHGNPAAPGAPQNLAGGEFIYWLENDPHARAYDVLNSPLGQHMQSELGIRRDGKLQDEAGYRNCLACHNLTTDLVRDGFAARTEGVSCEACHGAARDWVATHYRTSGERTVAARIQRREQFGMAHTAAPTERSQACVACHVGAADREVNHDLIAAGHPALKFEMTAYHDALPKHWDDRIERSQWPGMEFDLWKHGQISAAQQAIELLATRAERASTGTSSTSSWPELSEYSCYACHHDLAPNRTRQQTKLTERRRPGQLPYSNWYFAAFSENGSAAEAVRELRDTMQGSVRPDPVAIARHAQSVRTSLQTLNADWNSSADLRSSAWISDRLQGMRPSRDWDSAAQAYLLAVAYDLAKRDDLAARGSGKQQLAADDSQLAALATIRRQLGFAPDRDGPSRVESETSVLHDVTDEFERFMEGLRD